STVDIERDGDIVFPEIPDTFKLVFEQDFESNINYCYQIWQKS
ncbi:TPA: trimethoprim-resistant dihydrofolate reductase DfrA1, partial [Klebsiella pneumoniae]